MNYDYEFENSHIIITNTDRLRAICLNKFTRGIISHWVRINCESPKDPRHSKCQKRREKKRHSASFDCCTHSFIIASRCFSAYKSAIIAILCSAKCQVRFSPVTVIIKYVFLLQIRCEKNAFRTVYAELCRKRKSMIAVTKVSSEYLL